MLSVLQDSILFIHNPIPFISLKFYFSQLFFTQNHSLIYMIHLIVATEHLIAKKKLLTSFLMNY